MLYYSLIYPYFYYCNIVWASTYKTNLRRLVTPPCYPAKAHC